MEITTTTENEKHSSTVTVPLLSRVDRLEIAMRHLEMKQTSSSPGCSSSTANITFSPSSALTSEHYPQQPSLGLDLDMALKEVSFTGSLLERIKTLENRLFQLRLRVESDKLEARARSDQLSSSWSFPIITMNNQSRVAYKKHVAPNANMVINNTESQDTQQGKEQMEITSCNEEEDQEKSREYNKKKSKLENGGQGKRTRKKKKKKATRETEREKIESPNWTHFRILGC